MMIHSRTVFISAVITAFALVGFIGCSTAAPSGQKVEKAPVKSAITEITSNEQFKKILDNSPGDLLVFKLYADWCGPCRMLEPTMEKIAREHGGHTRFFKINVDKVPEVAGAFGANSIPMVVYVKDKASVEGFVGVRPEQDYVQAIMKHAAEAGAKQ